MRIVLIRHAEPAASADIEPSQWPLTTPGRIAAEQLRSRLPTGGRWVASEELKAIQTLEAARLDSGAEIVSDPCFNEVRRTEPFDDDFRSRRRAWVAGHLDERHATWETPGQASRRFDSGLRAHAGSGEDVLIVGSHGMVITAWLVLHGIVEAGEPAAELWESLPFPAMLEVELDDHSPAKVVINP